MNPNDAQSLTHMFDLDCDGARLWEPEELGAILEHQLAASVEYDLGRLDKDVAERLAAVNSAGGPPIDSFKDLLHHPQPPLEIVELTKRFAKACRSNPGGPLPDEVATVLYFLAIVVAMTRCRQRITGMDDQSLRHGLRWVLGQSWLDRATRELFEEGQAMAANAKET